MNTYYVTFGAGTLLRDYYAVVEARDEEIVRTWLNRRSRLPWSCIYGKVPEGRLLQERPLVLNYEHAEHIT